MANISSFIKGDDQWDCNNRIVIDKIIVTIVVTSNSLGNSRNNSTIIFIHVFGSNTCVKIKMESNQQNESMIISCDWAFWKWIYQGRWPSCDKPHGGINKRYRIHLPKRVFNVIFQFFFLTKQENNFGTTFFIYKFVGPSEK